MLIGQLIAAVAAGALLTIITMAVTALVLLMFVRPESRHSSGSVSRSASSRAHKGRHHKARHRAVVAIGATQ